MPETALKIKTYGNPVLRKRAKIVSQITERQRDILSQMVKLMYAQSGIGLAAPQVGISESMIIADIGSGLYKLINPKVIKKEGRQVLEEGCLSIPSVCIKVKRARKILVEAQDEYGKPIKIEAQDLLSCVLQHEIDHLKGKLIIDYASFFARLKMAKKLKRLKGKPGEEKAQDIKTKSCELEM